MQDLPIDPARVAAALDAAGLPRAPATVDALTGYLNLLARWNRTYNLTGTRDPRELVERHLVESITLSAWLHGERIADVGTGGGLPGLPLAIDAPERRFVLIESRVKRVRFLRHVVGSLRLQNVEVAHTRVEDLRCERPFDTVLARAVAPPAELIALTRHLTAPGTVLLMLTAARLEAEWRAIAADHGLVPQDIELAGPPLKSAVVRLQRVDESEA